MHTMHELCSELDMGYGTVHRILKDELNMSRVSTHWVPHLLKNHEMEIRVMDSKTFLGRFEKEGDAFLNRIITTDETWLFSIMIPKQSSSRVSGSRVICPLQRRQGCLGPWENTCS